MPPGSDPHMALFEGLYRRHFRLVWSVLTSLGVPSSAREDVAQDTWALVYRKQHLLRPDASEAAWVAALARGVVWGHRRSAGRRARREHAVRHTATRFTTGPEARFAAGHAVEVLLCRLSPEQKLAYVLVHGHGFSAREAGVATGVSGNTVSSRLRLARRTIRCFLDRNPDDRASLRDALHIEPEPGVQTRVSARLALLRGASMATVAAVAKPVLFAALVGTVGVLPRPDAPEPHTVVPIIAVHSPRPSLARIAPEPESATPPRALPVARPGSEPRARNRLPRRKSSPPGAEAPRLQEEARTLFNARRAIERCDAATALHILDEHQRRFPDTALRDVRDGLRVRALCQLGMDQRAARLAQARGVIEGLALTTCSNHPNGDETSIVPDVGET